jgi:hypothetical protein
MKKDSGGVMAGLKSNMVQQGFNMLRPYIITQPDTEVEKVMKHVFWLSTLATDTDTTMDNFIDEVNRIVTEYMGNNNGSKNPTE